jgi:hypothetical protein
MSQYFHPNTLSPTSQANKYKNLATKILTICVNTPIPTCPKYHSRFIKRWISKSSEGKFDIKTDNKTHAFILQHSLEISLWLKIWFKDIKTSNHKNCNLSIKTP